MNVGRKGRGTSCLHLDGQNLNFNGDKLFSETIAFHLLVDKSMGKVNGSFTAVNIYLQIDSYYQSRNPCNLGFAFRLRPGK